MSQITINIPSTFTGPIVINVGQPPEVAEVDIPMTDVREPRNDKQRKYCDCFRDQEECRVPIKDVTHIVRFHRPTIEFEIVETGERFKSPSRVVKKLHQMFNSEHRPSASANGWAELQVFRDGSWVSAEEIRDR